MPLTELFPAGGFGEERAGGQVFVAGGAGGSEGTGGRPDSGEGGSGGAGHGLALPELAAVAGARECSLAPRLASPDFWIPMVREAVSRLDVAGGASASVLGSPVYDGLGAGAWCFNRRGDRGDALVFGSLGVDLVAAQAATGFTVSLWTRAEPAEATGMAEGGHALQLSPTGGAAAEPYFWVGRGGAGSGGHTVALGYSDGGAAAEHPAAAADGLWHHVVWVARTDLRHELYVDGERAVVTPEKRLPASLGASPVLSLGHAPVPDTVASAAYDGCVRDVRVYTHAASQNDVSALLSASRPDSAFEKLAWLPMRSDDGNRSALEDVARGGEAWTVEGADPVPTGSAEIGLSLQFDAATEVRALASLCTPPVQPPY